MLYGKWRFMTNLMSGGIEVWRKIPWTTISWSDVDKIYAMPVPWTSKSCPWQPPVDFTTHLPSVLWPIFTHLSDPQNQEPISRYSGNNLVLLKIYIILLLFRQACTKHMLDFENSMFCSKAWAQRQSSGPSFGLWGMKAPNMRGW